MLLSRLAPLLLVVITGTAARSAAAADSWLQWGGPGRDFKTGTTRLAETWPEGGPDRLWSRVLGEAYSSVLVEGPTLYTMYRRGDQEIVVAIDSGTGRTRWEYAYGAPPLKGQVLDFGKGPNATALIVGDHIYTAGFTSKVHCLDRRKGTLVWSHDLVSEMQGQALEFGYSSSPIVYGRSVVFLVGGARHAAVAFDLLDGSIQWKADPADIGYSSPIVIDVGGEDQLAFMTPTEVVAVGMADGRVKWRRHHENQYKVNCIGPWDAGGDLLFVSSQGDVGSRTLRLRLSEGTTLIEEIARNHKVKLFHSTAILDGDYIYGSSGSYLVAYNTRTGEVAWRERGFPQTNLIQAGDRVVLLDENGRLGLATLTPEKMTLHTTHQLLEKPAWTVPTLVGTRLYVRGNGKLLALNLGAE